VLHASSDFQKSGRVLKLPLKIWIFSKYCCFFEHQFIAYGFIGLRKIFLTFLLGSRAVEIRNWGHFRTTYRWHIFGFSLICAQNLVSE